MFLLTLFLYKVDQPLFILCSAAPFLGVILVLFYSDKSKGCCQRDCSCFCLVCDNTLLLPSLFQDYQACGCMLRWIRKLTLLKAIHWSCRCFFAFQSYLFHHPIYCIATWTCWYRAESGKMGKEDMWQLTRTAGKRARAATLTHRYPAGDAAGELHSKPSRQNGEVRNVGLCVSNLLYLLVVPQFI